MAQADRARRLPTGLGWLVLLLVLGLGMAGLLASAAITDVHAKQAAADATAARSATARHIDALVLAVGTEAEALPNPADAGPLDTLQQIEAGTAAWRAAAPPAERPHVDILAVRVAEFAHLRREVAHLVREHGVDDARLFLGSEPVRENRRSLERALAAASAITAEQLAHDTALLAEARQRWQSVVVGLLAVVVLLAFLQVVRLARRPVQRPADSLPDLLDAIATGAKRTTRIG